MMIKKKKVRNLKCCDCKLVVSSANGMWYVARKACDVWLRQGTKWALQHGASVAELFSPVFLVSHWISLSVGEEEGRVKCTHARTHIHTQLPGWFWLLFGIAIS